MRNWPYAYSLGNADDSVIAGNFSVAPLPSGPNGTPSATLGGWQLAVSRYSANPDVAADFALFAASYEGQKQNALMTSRIPTIEALYSDEDVLAEYPWFGSLFDVFTNAVARPSTATAPNYSATSAVFFNAVNSVLIGDTDAATAVAEIELDLQDLLGFESGTP
jgi:trehalose/maltose transport system substrate-binding protein